MTWCVKEKVVLKKTVDFLHRNLGTRKENAFMHAG
jgi:hypothetical protein